MVDRIESYITLDQFQDLYLDQSRFCIFSQIFTDDWRSRHEWVTNGKPNLEFLSEQFGTCVIQAADCSKKQFNSHEKVKMTFKEFLEYWRAFPNENQGLLYLKDWHFQREFPSYRAYEVPEYFQSDWLNEWYDQNEECIDDYRFVYMGPKGTWTAFHADVLRSYSWSANICGKKRWLLYPPGEEENLKDRLGNLPFDVTSSEMADAVKYPNFHKAVDPIEVIQEAGEIVFVPSCWYHQVHNLEDTISINHNWTNAYGINYVLRHLQEELKLVEKEIAEFRGTDGWPQQCQLLLKCTAGMDYSQFMKMLLELMEPRFKVLKHYTMARKYSHGNTSTNEGDIVGRNCALNVFKRFDITCVPKEHLEFGNEDISNTLQDRTLLDARLGRLEFDLYKLRAMYLRLYANCDSKLEPEKMKRGNELVQEIEELLLIRKEI